MSLRVKTRNYLVFLWRCARIAFVGDWRYQVWMGLLTCIILVGINAYAKQFVNGLIVTGMSDQVSWGRLYRQLHLYRRSRRRRGDAGHPVYIYNNRELARPCNFRRTARGRLPS
jgi:molybdopterin-containing oxidoreductase family membrane subunit